MKWISSKTIYFISSIIFLVIAYCPLVDYYCQWYITLMPISILAFAIIGGGDFKILFKVLLLAFVFSCFENWFLHRRYEFMLEFRNNMMAFTPLVLTIYVCRQTGIRFQKYFFQIVIILMLITSITTIVGLGLYPNACRSFASYGDVKNINLYRQLNIGGYDFIYSIPILLPLIFVYNKNICKGIVSIFNYIIIFVLMICVYKSSYTTALILTLVSVSLIIIGVKPNLKPLFVGFTIVVLILGGTGLLADIFLWLSNIVESDYSSDRLLQVSMVLNGTPVSDINTNTTNERLELYETSLRSFISSPIWGNNFIDFNKELLSGHSLILDTLAGAGLIGAFIVYKLFKNIFTTIAPIKINNYFIRCSITMFVLVSIYNPSTFMLIYIVIFTYPMIINNLCLDMSSIKRNV